MLKKLLFILLLYFAHHSSLVAASELESDFFNVCGVKNIEKILKNNNSKYSNTEEIEEIERDSFKTAMYIYLYYRDKKQMPFELISSVGYQNIINIPFFANNVISYAIYNGVSQQELKGIIQTILTAKNSSFNDKKNIYLNALKNITFDKRYKKIVKKMLDTVFYGESIDVEEIAMLKNKYKSFIEEEYFIQQVRHRLWNNNHADIERIKKISFKKNTKEYIAELVDLNAGLAQSCGWKKKHNFDLNQCVNTCKKLSGKDTYIDLVCLGFLYDHSQDLGKTLKLIKKNVSSNFLPDKWLKYKLLIARTAIDGDKDIESDTYEIIANGGKLKTRNGYYTQQFLAGLIAYLRGDYHSAVLHFSKCAKKSKNSEYKAKAFYWLGLSYKKNGDRHDSLSAYINAKNHPFTMYGQLAAEELGYDPESIVEEAILNFTKNKQMLCDNINFIVGYLEQYDKKITNQNKQDYKFSYASENILSYIRTETDKNKIFNAIATYDDDFDGNLAQEMAFYALNYDVVYKNLTYSKALHTSDALIGALIRKESNFRTNKIGSVGERGLMQIRPKTGRNVAKQIGMEYNNKKLLSDEQYNIKIGSHYLNSLLEKFDNNKLLALSSYNAGISNVMRWIKKNGDPRTMKTNEEVVTWIEKIPFSFTRSYAMNILGNEMTIEVLKRVFL